MENLGVEEDTTAQWDQVAPLLDDGLTHLAAKDHEAVVLRFFQKKTFPEIATLTGSTEEGARKRVDRAVGKLRRFLTQRGVVGPAVALMATMAANSVQATPLAVTAMRAIRWVRLKWLASSGVTLLVATTITFSVLRSQALSGSPLQTFRLVTQAINQGDGDF